MKYKIDGKISGIYLIKNTVDGKVYVGKSKNIYERYMQYVRDFKKQAAYHMNTYLLRAMNKHGFENFEMTLLEECHICELSDRELFWMIELESLGDKGYNLRSDTDQGMMTHPLTSKKISDRLRFEWESGIRDGHGEKLRASWEFRDRKSQADLMRKNLTKWKYEVDHLSNLSYLDLQCLGLGGVLGKFAKYKINDVEYKGHDISRTLISDEIEE